MHMPKSALTIIYQAALFSSAFFSFAAACLWYLSTGLKVPFAKESRVSVVNNHNYDISRTSESQAKWSRYAAGAAAISALLQGIAITAGEIRPENTRKEPKNLANHTSITYQSSRKLNVHP